MQQHEEIMEDPWDSYKEILQHLFLTENRTLKSVKEFMNDTYGFRARYTWTLDSEAIITNLVNSIAQYENRFKKWGFRKKQTARKWIDVQGRVEKRKRDGKESNVYNGGRLVPQKKVRKEISRHNFPTIQERYGEGIILQRLCC